MHKLKKALIFALHDTKYDIVGLLILTFTFELYNCVELSILKAMIITLSYFIITNYQKSH
ncbi:hypothetical protein DXA09_00990 [Absiella sp. AM54-8XD]|jgi:hypothetical protein|uniref:hypothetical protein n=1 Tax=[Eubacterium] hominis TaxID=2764325 RepID=UPI000E3F25D8|nr:hypothetical protein DW271_00690 [Absiella sp. AM22-9]RGB60016.1 hypothetical protein DW120_10315 [Absiella sp. AM10-20]RGB63588.1 hypothetical protein DW113_18080 [Absiella sp. AM09-45]RGB72353.1 hypothetical protein DW114_18460 [Absiella sp. AM09-50]RGC26583.1 hypothetical protein DXA09_00990 [Absiella sp. AM54-8XD]RHU08139.1 hypothetical protein DW716_06680 [Absiella sp. AM27-20]DAY68649.1 MAG TPA: hypothetical protein [Caudoviricetes sp.]